MLGRPSPIPKGGMGTLPDAEGPEPNNGFDSLAGVPGGVVLGSLAGDKLEDPKDFSSDGADGNTSIVGTSGWGVDEGERDIGKGTAAGSGGESLPSESSAAELSSSADS